jgi:hypothetical protein
MFLGTNKSLVNGFINIPEPLPNQIYIEDIAHRLSNINRFNGAGKCFFSVAQHSVNIANLCYEHAANLSIDPDEAFLAGLLHDAPEAFYGDFISPVKIIIGSEALAWLKDVDATVFKALNVTNIMQRCEKLWKWADLNQLFSEAAMLDIFGEYVINDKIYTVKEHNVVPEPFTLNFAYDVPLGPGECKQLYIDAYIEYSEKLGILQ